jgi:pre-mRNA-splicing factor ISY1
VLGLPVDEDPPKMPQWHVSRRGSAPHPPVSDQPSAKRKARDDDGGGADTAVVDTDDPKRAKTLTVDGTAPTLSDAVSPDDAARAAAAFIPFLAPEELTPPKLPSRGEVEEVLLTLRKKALMSEYFGGGGEAVDV